MPKIIEPNAKKVSELPRQKEIHGLKIDAWITDIEATILCNLSGKRYLEIGTWEGFSAIAVSDSFEEVWTIDPTPTNSRHYMLLRLFCYFSNIQYIRKKSEEIASIIKENYFDVVFIDGKHDFDSVLRDARNYYCKVKYGGHLVFHDYYNPGQPEVRIAVDHFLKENPFFKLSFDGSNTEFNSLLILERR